LTYVLEIIPTFLFTPWHSPVHYFFTQFIPGSALFEQLSSISLLDPHSTVRSPLLIVIAARAPSPLIYIAPAETLLSYQDSHHSTPQPFTTLGALKTWPLDLKYRVGSFYEPTPSTTNPFRVSSMPVPVPLHPMSRHSYSFTASCLRSRCYYSSSFSVSCTF